MSHSGARDIADDDDHDDWWPGRKVPNGGCGHHVSKYYGDRYYDDARIRNRDDGMHCPNIDAGSG